MLEDVTTPGIVKKIVEYYGDKAEKIVENLEIEKLMEVPGLGKKTALGILRKAYEIKTGETFQDILCNDAQSVYEDIVQVLQEYPCTQSGKNRFLVHYPMTNKHIIEKRLDYSRKAVEFVKGLEKGQLSALLEKLHRLRPLTMPKKKKYRDRVIACDVVEVYTAVKNVYCDVLLIEDPADISDLEQYPLVFYVYTGESELYEYLLDKSDMQFFFSDFSIENAIPELLIEQFIENEKTILFMCDIAEILHSEDTHLTEIKNALTTLKEKVITEEIDIDTLVYTLESDINKKFDEAMQKELIELKGNELLTMMQQVHTDPVQALKRSIPDSVISLYSDLIAEANQEITKVLGMRAEVFSLELVYPIEADNRRLEELKDEIRKNKAVKEFNAKRDVARIGKHWEYILQKERDMHELDFKTALGRFFIDYCMNPPLFVDAGLSFRDGLNIIIHNPRPVTYKIGETPHGFATEDRVAVLTGANSGGKTTLLETVLHIQILAQMGFFVPAAECFCPVCEEIIYLRKPKNQFCSQNYCIFFNLFRSKQKYVVCVSYPFGKRDLRVEYSPCGRY
jgi:hypothetical protein